ncbi:prolipoprotein diacylglyceryl transferase [Candidatus Gracilibacteria bacterium]|nr:MAG: prolipoprotein diacylglyceryl transferase [Candidatus Gracilibacteria bacterium]
MHIFTLQIGNFTLAPTWYGLMYALGFLIGFLFLRANIQWKDKKHLDSLLFFVFLSVILGGRIGYILLYNLDFYIQNPLEIISIWNGGMSFHGGFLGVLIGVYIFCKKYSYKYWDIMDIIAVIVPIALGLGRIGNWINGELPGYAIYRGPLPMMQNGVPHFPSPLFEMLLEGIILFGVLFTLFKLIPQKVGTGFLSSIFLIGYGLARLIAEQFRLPDIHIGYLFDTNWITLGMIYTIPMIIAGILLLIFSLQKKTQSI